MTESDGPGEAARTRVAAWSGTPARVLHRLAVDSARSVRAAVALNAASPPEAHALLARDADERVRVLLARKLAGLLPDLSGTARDAARARVLQTLAVLVADEADRVRVAIAELVADLPEFPRTLILRLARDSVVAVSEPVIRLSPLLTPADLLALLDAPPHPQVGRAMAGRAHVPEEVCDLLARSGDDDTVRTLLANPSAAIREATLDWLVAHAAGRETWHAPLVQRPILHAAAARALSDIVAVELLRVLVERADLDPQVTAALRQGLNEWLDPAPDTLSCSTSLRRLALRRAQNLQAAGRLDAGCLLASARLRDVPGFAAQLAVASGTALEMVERASRLRSAKGIVSLVWNAALPMGVATAAQPLLAGLGPDEALAPGRDGGFPLSVDEMRWQLGFLERAGP